MAWSIHGETLTASFILDIGVHVCPIRRSAWIALIPFRHRIFSKYGACLIPLADPLQIAKGHSHYLPVQLVGICWFDAITEVTRDVFKCHRAPVLYLADNVKSTDLLFNRMAEIVPGWT